MDTVSIDEETQNEINEVLDCFDFEKVHKVMVFLDWHWASLNGVPKIYDLRQKARRIIEDAIKSVLNTKTGSCSIETGGFIAKVYGKTDEDQKIRIKLQFKVTSMDNFD